MTKLSQLTKKEKQDQNDVRNLSYYSLMFACKKIGANPEIGLKYSAVNENLLGYKSGKHIIFYHTISIDEIEIIRILHERMDLKKRLST